MSLLNIHNVTKSFGANELLHDATLSVEKNDRIGLIGSNGVGKTTLFKMIIGTEPADSGNIIKAADLSVGYLEQHVCAASDRTAYAETLQVFDPLTKLEMALDELNLQLCTDHSSALIERQLSLTEQFQAQGGLTYKNRTTAVLTGLGFTAEQQQLPVSALSGGQRSKIGLAKLLLSQNDLILLDEPTNHLDIESVIWLEEFIANFGAAAIIISHDRYFLDRVTNKTAEIENGKLYVANGNFSRYQEQKQQRLLAEQREYDNKMKEIHRIEGIIEQQKRWNKEKNIKTAESKQKQIDRIAKDLVRPEMEKHDIKFSFTCANRSGETVMRAFGDSCKFENGYLYKDVSFTIRRGERVFLIGPNGAGKSTLIRRMLSNNSENFETGVGVLPAYFEQFQEGINPKATPFDVLHNAYPNMTDTAVRNALAAFEFYGDDVFKLCGELSGGERARVAICKIMLSENNFLILDEPTNHLDIHSGEALEKALKLYEGTLLIVSHDRYFINRLADKIIYLRSDGSVTVQGNYDDFLALDEKQSIVEQKTSEPVMKENKGKEVYLQNKKRAAEGRKLKSTVQNLEKDIEKAEQTIKEIDEQMAALGDDYLSLAKLTEQLQTAQQQLEQKMKAWDEAVEKLGEFEEK